VLQFLGAAINYGGRVTDKQDKRLIESIIKRFICADVIDKEKSYKFSSSGMYYCPEAETQDGFLEYLRDLPISPNPEVFGLHENCELTTAETESMALLHGILSMAPRSSGGGGQSSEDAMDEMAVTLIDKTPSKFDPDVLEEKFPTVYEESRNTVLKQEAAKYNRLLSVLMLQLPLFRRALKGFVMMTEELEDLGTGLFTNSVPQAWASKGFLSLKPLSSWIKDLNDRVDFLNKWADGGAPINFWLSGLFFPQAFFTATLQNYARGEKIAIDRLKFDFSIHDEWALDGSDIKEHPKVGCYVWGLFLEGCRWDYQTHALGPSNPKQLFVELPVTHFIPAVDRKPGTGVYHCPIYKVLSRSGTLSTTGHSTNFVLFMEVPCKTDPDNWIVGGVAGFLALKY